MDIIERLRTLQKINTWRSRNKETNGGTKIVWMLRNKLKRPPKGGGMGMTH